MNHAEVSGSVVSVSRQSLPSGMELLIFDVDTGDGGVPVEMMNDPSEPHQSIRLREGDQVVVSGPIRRRFFRVGGQTQSRTFLSANTLGRVPPQ